MDFRRIAKLLGDDGESTLDHRCTAVGKSGLALPGVDFVERVWMDSRRSPRVLANLQRCFDQGRLSGSGYLVLGAGDVELAIEGGCSGFVGTLGQLRAHARRHAHRIPMVVAVGGSEQPGGAPARDTVRQIAELGAVALWLEGGTSEGELAEAAREQGLAVISAGEADSLAAEADLRVEALPEPRTPTARPGLRPRVVPHPIDLARGRVARAQLGRVGLLHRCGGEGVSLPEAVRLAVVNKRGGGMGLVLHAGLAALPREEGVALLHALQDVYRCGEVTVA